MQIRSAELQDRPEITALYVRSQLATGLPDPNYIAPSELGSHLYARHAVERYVASMAGNIVGHAMIETPNPEHLVSWNSGLKPSSSTSLLELGGAFVEPLMSRKGIWSSLLQHRLRVVRTIYESTPVTVTWTQNSHVISKFLQAGGIQVDEKQTDGGPISLFVF